MNRQNVKEKMNKELFHLYLCMSDNLYGTVCRHHLVDRSDLDSAQHTVWCLEVPEEEVNRPGRIQVLVLYTAGRTGHISHSGSLLCNT